MPTAMELPINSTFLMLLKVLGNITKDAKLNRIAAYSDGSMVGAAWKISLITAKFVDQTTQIARTTPFQSTDDFFSPPAADFVSRIFVDVSSDFMFVAVFGDIASL